MSAMQHPGPLLRDLRNAAGLRIADVAERIGRPIQTCSQWERGERPIPYDVLDEWAAVFDRRVVLQFPAADGRAHAPAVAELLALVESRGTELSEGALSAVGALVRALADDAKKL